MNKKYIHASIPAIVAVIAILAMGSTELAYAQDTPDLPDELPVNFKASDLVIIVLGVLGGLTVAFLGKANATAKDPTEKFNGAKFARPIIVAVLASIPLAITASLQYTELNLVTMFLIYGASGFVAVVSNNLKTHTPK